MKKSFVAVGLFLISVSAFATDCPDFSGHYVYTGTDAKATLSITQTGCEKLDAVYDFGNGKKLERPMVLDGMKRTLIDNKDLLSVEAYTLKESTILVDTESTWKKKNITVHSTGKIGFDANQNLVEETVTYDDKGKPVSHDWDTYKKQ